MAATMFLAIVLLLIMLLSVQATSGELSIVAMSFPDPGNNKPNTFVATSRQVGSSLLGSGVPALLWLVVKSSDVTAACQQIVGKGRLSFGVTVTDGAIGDQESFTVKVTATGGCEGAPDESGTEMVWVDSSGRSAALVCPKNAGSTGCGVYMTGSGVTAFYNRGSRRRILSTGIRPDGLQCTTTGLIGGFIIGNAVGIYTAGYCAFFPPPVNVLCAATVAIGVPFLGALLVGCKIVNDGRSCFPGDATLQLAGGISKRMFEVDIGDKVAVRKHDGTFGYEDIYCFGHRDGITSSRFYKISMNSSEGFETSLELSGRHFAPILSPGIGDQKMVYLRAQEIRVGDMMWGVNKNAMAIYRVTGITIKVKQGLYNPFTMTGNIIVNGVVASVHSDWFLDKVFDKLGMTHLLPTTYQVVLAPPRIMYKVIGKNFYTIAYDWLDQHLNLVQHISDYSGIGASIVLASAVAIAPSLYYLKKSTQ